MSEERHLFRHTPSDGGPRTNWHAYRLDEIWQMVADEDGQVNWQQYDSWRRTAELCNDQADQLSKATAELLQRWPARPGSAAWAFKSFVDGLIGSMRQSASTAIQTREALRQITIGLSAARSEIAWLREERQRYEQAELSLTPQPTPQPGQIPHSVPPSLPRPPDNWREALDQRARLVMAETDVKIGAAATGLKVPAAFRMRIDDVDGTAFASANGSTDVPGSMGRAPDIPLPLYEPPLAGGRNQTNDPGQPRPDDPRLDGSAVVPRLPGTITPATGHSDVVAGKGPLPIPWITRLTPTGESTSNRPNAPMARSVTPSTAAARPRPIAAGSVTGSGSMIAPPMGMRSAPDTPRQGVVPGGRQPLYRRKRSGRAVDSDDPWAVREGGPSVLQPPPEPTEHDPGPGVIGIDR